MFEYKWKQLKPIAEADVSYGPARKLVYYPGLACSDRQFHSDRAADLTHAFILTDGRVLGPKCLQNELGGIPISDHEVHKYHWMPRYWDEETRENWRDTTAKKYWRLIRIIGLIDQIHVLIGRDLDSSHRFEAILNSREQELPRKFKAFLLKGVRMYGVGECNSWDYEMAESEQKLTHWRDDLFRVIMMKQVIEGYQRYWGTKRMNELSKLSILESLFKWLKRKPLTDNQKKMLIRFEGEYLDARLSYTSFQCNMVMNDTPLGVLV